MTTVAVAGGTGGVGKTLVETLEQQSKFRVVVLSRSVSNLPNDSISSLLMNQKESKEMPATGTLYVQIDYNDVPALTRQLEHHNIHTIISAIGLISEETSNSQMHLIEAAEKSEVTKRFIPSEYSFIQTAE